VKPLPPPFDTIAAGLPTRIERRGQALLNSRMLTKDLAFSDEERDAFDLRGLLPDQVQTIEKQVEIEMGHVRRKIDPLEQYIGLMALQDRNATLYYRVLADNLEELLPIVYTPTVGRACQEFSYVLRRTRGLWITPADRDRIPDLLRSVPYPDVRLIVVTDNERILGLGDQGAGGMGIPLGKLALYTAACGIHPAVTLPVSLDVGTDNEWLLADPFYVGYRSRRLRGVEYDELVDAFVRGVAEVWPGCLIQWEDFKQHNALTILDRYRDEVFSFNDDIQGTAATVLGGVLAALRHRGEQLRDQRAVLAGAGAAGVGIARVLRTAMIEDGASESEAARNVVLLDSRGLVHAGRNDLEPAKAGIALPADAFASYGFGSAERTDLLDVVGRVRPTILVGTTGVSGTFTEPVIRTLAAGVAPRQPIVMPLSNPTSAAEATPSDVLAWSGGAALVATGSPFEAVVREGVRHEIGQANNVFIFPGLGLGSIVAESRSVTQSMVLAAARALADATSAARVAAGALYPPITDLRVVARAVAVAVAAEAVRCGVAGIADGLDLEAEVDAGMWWPAYAPYLPAS
jgi:malic enzyme